jgi:antitoxin component of MazEF toxin-antitoxin module
MQRDIRHILRVGNSSLAVALPKGWVDYYGLQAGDVVEVTANSKIVIRRISGGAAK